VAGLIHWGVASRPWPKGRFFEVYLLHLFFWGTGLGSLFSFYAMTFEPLASTMAADLGRQAHNGFQLQAGLGLLVIGVLGVLCIWVRGVFWVATTVVAGIVGWTSVAVVYFNGAPPAIARTNLFYDGFGTLLIALVLVIYRLRAGHARFWAPTIGHHAEQT